MNEEGKAHWGAIAPREKKINSQEKLIENNEMGGACGACGGGERCAQGSGGET